MKPKRMPEPTGKPEAALTLPLASESVRTQSPCPIVLESLTPLQRRRLDAAVMLLVNYLVSASAGGGDML